MYCNISLRSCASIALITIQIIVSVSRYMQCLLLTLSKNVLAKMRRCFCYQIHEFLLSNVLNRDSRETD